MIIPYRPQQRKITFHGVAGQRHVVILGAARFTASYHDLSYFGVDTELCELGIEMQTA
jgi:hypothetical protein